MGGAAKPVIINIVPHGPAYHYAPDERPEICWQKPDGDVVGCWSREWPDLLGKAVLRVDDKYDWEVWQPDVRADRCYSATLETGVVHRLFPATERMYRPGVRSMKGLYSEAMLSRIVELQRWPVILQLHGFRVPFYSEVLRLLDTRKNWRVVSIGHGLVRPPLCEVFGMHRPMTYVCLLVEHWKLRRALAKVDVMTEQTTSALADFRRVYRGRIEQITMGCDFGFWTPVPSRETRLEVRGELGIGAGTTVFFASGNFIPRKQLEELVRVFRACQSREDWFLLVAGHGDRPNTERLVSEIEPLVTAGKAMLHPYVEGPALRKLYWASDAYVSVATDEGGPVSVMKAMACGLPVLSTPVGETSERMRLHGAGKFIPVSRFDEWKVAIEEILDKGMPPVLNRAIAQAAYDWPQVAGRFIAVYDDLCKDYFSSRAG